MESKSREKESERERKGEAVDPGEPRRQAARLARAGRLEWWHRGGNAVLPGNTTEHGRVPPA